MTEEELTICKMYLEDLDRTHDCNEYKLLMGLLEQQSSEDCISRAEVQKFVSYIQSIKDSHNEQDTPINYGTICDLVIRGWKLMELPPVTPKIPTSEDCVSRAEVLQMIEDIQNAGGFIGYNTYSEAFDRVDNMTPVTPTRKKGKWINSVYSVGFTCTCCLLTQTSSFKYNFCPNCGAEMINTERGGE